VQALCDDVRRQLAVESRPGDDHSGRYVGGDAACKGELVGKGTAETGVCAVSQDVSSDVDEHELIGAEVFRGGRDLLGKSSRPAGRVEQDDP
jgi:hypothetical protein